jgi:dihydrolipoamide dehydrogenase
MAEFDYDAIVIGSGPGGGAAAQQVVHRGGRACLIESGLLGGTCVNRGCMPSKALLASGERYWAMQTADEVALPPVRPGADTREVMRRVREITRTLHESMEKKLTNFDGIDLIRGRGKLAGPNEVIVETDAGEREITGRCIVIATGSEPIRPDFLPWDDERVWTSDDALRAEELPQRITIMGGGILGCEFATAYSELGLSVRVVEMMDHLLPPLDPEAGGTISDALAERGAEVFTGVKVREVETRPDELLVRLEDDQELPCDVLLVAVGRKARPEGLDLESGGLEVNASGVPAVDERCRSAVESIYAVGDAAETRQFAHLAERMGVVAGDNIMGAETIDDRRVVPSGVYTHPEVGSVGPTEAAAREEHPDLEVLRYDYSHSGTAFLYAREEGWLKVLLDPKSEAILGATWVGPHAVDRIAEVALAMKNHLTIRDIYHSIHPHPGFQEALQAAAEAWAIQQMGQA